MSNSEQSAPFRFSHMRATRISLRKLLLGVALEVAWHWVAYYILCRTFIFSSRILSEDLALPMAVNSLLKMTQPTSAIPWSRISCRDGLHSFIQKGYPSDIIYTLLLYYIYVFNEYLSTYIIQRVNNKWLCYLYPVYVEASFITIQANASWINFRYYYFYWREYFTCVYTFYPWWFALWETQHSAVVLQHSLSLRIVTIGNNVYTR